MSAPACVYVCFPCKLLFTKLYIHTKCALMMMVVMMMEARYGQYAFYDETNLKMGDSESFLFVHSQRFRIHSLYNLLTR